MSKSIHKIWYLVQLKPNSSQIADRNLKRQGFEIYLPEIEVTSTRRGRFVSAKTPLFPGYIFVATNSNSGPWQRINSTVGISRVVAFGGQPAAVPPDLIASLILYCSPREAQETEAQFQAGDLVQLVTGPFVNLIAEIESVAAGQRIWILLDVLGKQTRVALDRSQIRLAG